MPQVPFPNNLFCKYILIWDQNVNTFENKYSLLDLSRCRLLLRSKKMSSEKQTSVFYSIHLTVYTSKKYWTALLVCYF